MAPKKGQKQKKLAVSYQYALRDLQGLPDMVKAQVEAGLDEDEAVSNHYKSWCDKIPLIDHELSDTQVASLLGASNKAPWSPEQKLDLGKRISSLKGAAAEAKHDKPIQRRLNQKCHNFENYLDQDRMINIRSAGISKIARAHQMADVAASIGMINPDEASLYRMGSILYWGEDNYDATQDDVFLWMDRIQTYIKTKRVNKSLPYIYEFPASAIDLPEETKLHAYPRGLPVDVDIPELSSILGGAKMRGRPANKGESWIHSVPLKYRKIVQNAVACSDASEA